MIPQIENAHPAGVMSNGYLSDSPPIVFWKIAKPPTEFKVLNISAKIKDKVIPDIPISWGILWSSNILSNIHSIAHIRSLNQRYHCETDCG